MNQIHYILLAFILAALGSGIEFYSSALPSSAARGSTSTLVETGLAPAAVPSRAGDATAVRDLTGALTKILAAVVRDGGAVDYGLLRGDLDLEFRRVLKAVEEYGGPLRTQNEKLAFWINAYNVQMLQSIIEHPEATSVVENGLADKFFKTKFRTAGMDITLDKIEHAILRRSEPGEYTSLAVETLDPRIHVALNCAAVSCPALRTEAFVAGRIGQQLESAMEEFANSERHFRVSGDHIIVSSLLDWFGNDWDQDGPAGDFILRYMDRSRPNYQQLADYLEGASSDEIRDRDRTEYEYIWTVNAVRLQNRQ